MIRFDKIKKTKEKTYFFFSGRYKRDLIWCLKECGVTDFEIVRAGEDHSYGGKLPENINIKPVFIEGKSSKPIEFPPVLISNLEIAGLEKLMPELYKGWDEDLRAHKRDVSNRILANMDARQDYFTAKERRE